MNFNKKMIVPTASIVALLLGAGALYWYLATPGGKDLSLERSFNQVVSSNRADNFRQALPTVLPKNRPAEFEFYYENRDDEVDYAESLLINQNEAYIKISTAGTIKTVPFTLSDETKDALYQALFTIPFDQIRVESLPLKNLPIPGEVFIGDVEKPSTQVETLRVAFGQNQAERQNIMYVSGPTTEITDQSRPNWDIAKNLALEILEKYRPQK